MSENHNSFRNSLLAQEQPNSKLQQNFQLEMKKMYTEKIKTGQRFAYVLASLLIAVITLAFWAFAKMFEEMQMKYDVGYIEPLRLASMWAMFLGAALIVLSLWPAIRGKVGLRFYPKVIRFIFWILILVIFTLYFATFDMIEEHVQPGISSEIMWIFSMMTLVIVMGVYLLLSGRIDCGDMKNKAKTLELEYRLAELEEKLASSQES